MKKDLFVFAGQSNMMGAAALPPKRHPVLKNSFEYKHKPRRLGAPRGSFVSSPYPVGEFSYADLSRAYGEGVSDENRNSTLASYGSSTYFCPAMCNMKSKEDKTVFSFSEFSEADFPCGVSLAPLLAEQWELFGYESLYTHVAKGGVVLAYYMTDEMAEEYSRRIRDYNSENGTSYSEKIRPDHRKAGAAEYFFEKCTDFFADAEEAYKDALSPDRCFIWLQGESDAGKHEAEYGIALDILWERLKDIGFTRFFCIRVDYFGSENIATIMRAQESFVKRHPDAYMLTRAASFILHPNNKEGWFSADVGEEYKDCRDSFFGFDNHHINEKGFELIAARCAQNMRLILKENKAPILEEERISRLIEG